MKKNLHFIAALFFASSFIATAQNKSTVQKGNFTVLEETISLTKVKPNDSLSGFNEQQARELAPFKGITAEEMDVYMAISKRDFIKSKYNLVSKPQVLPVLSGSKTSSAVCVNEDFEEGSLTSPVPGTINVTSPTGINGWTTYSGTTPATANGSCLLTGCCVGAPNAVQLIAPGPAGMVDPIIGASYPIHSVFGNNLNSAASTLNGFNCYGDWFIKLNNTTPGAGLSRLTKTITVTPSNVIFNFAYIAVVQGAHCCCDNGGVSIIFKDCLGNMLASASQFSISPPAGTGCTPMGICASPSTITTLNAPTAGWYYNKWANSSIDLSLWMGNCIQVEVTAIDCPYSGHAGYAYFDAQCASTIVNSVSSLTNEANLNLYPNPNNGIFNLDVAQPIQNGEIEIRNILGQVVLREEIKQGSNKINSQNLLKGIYTYAVLQNKEVIHIGKVIIE